MSDLVHLHILCPRKLKEDVKKKADENLTTITKIILQKLKEYLNEDDGKTKEAE